MDGIHAFPDLLRVVAVLFDDLSDYAVLSIPDLMLSHDMLQQEGDLEQNKIWTIEKLR